MDDNPLEQLALSRLVEERNFVARNIFITGEINDKVARAAISQLMAFSDDSDRPINVFISSPGGHVESGDAIHDMIQFVKPVVRTIGTGWVASAGALIFVAASRENRFCLPNTRFLLHQPSGGMQGVSSDMAIQAEQIIKMKARLNRIFADATGQPLSKVEQDTERDFWMTPAEAIDYGLLYKVINSSSDLSQ